MRKVAVPKCQTCQWKSKIDNWCERHRIKLEGIEQCIMYYDEYMAQGVDNGINDPVQKETV